MNFIGLDNVKGYTPEVLQKLTREADLRKKTSVKQNQDILSKQKSQKQRKQLDASHLEKVTHNTKTPISSRGQQRRATAV